jgi:hypothetical protein
MWFGSHNAGWFGSLAYYRDVLHLPIHRADGLIGLGQTAGWIATYKHVAILQHRHNILRLDDLGRPHCEVGPSVLYRDGWGVYAWHGFRVEERIIMRPETITVDEIIGEPNAELRRIKIERYGVGKFVEKSGAEVVDLDERTSIGGGPRGLFRLKTGEQYLVGTDGSTKRVYWMPVPDDAKTCREAHQAIACVRDETTIKLEG